MEENKQIVKGLDKKWRENAEYLATKLKVQNYEDIERHFKDFTSSVILDTLTTKDLAWQKKIEEAIKSNMKTNDTRELDCQCSDDGMHYHCEKSYNLALSDVLSLLLPPITTK